MTNIKEDKPQETVTAGPQSLEGKTHETTSQDQLHRSIALAFDYRGDVTLHFKDGTEKSGFVYNFSFNSDSVELFVPTSKKDSVPESCKLSGITAIHFSGPDTAFGKSWEDWMTKSSSEKKQEAQKSAQEAQNLGHL